MTESIATIDEQPIYVVWIDYLQTKAEMDAYDRNHEDKRINYNIA